MIKVKKINKCFNEAKILNNVSFNLGEGDYLAVLGPSGSGKSSLLNSISGMDRIDEGQVLFRGTDISKLDEIELSKFRLDKMGFVFQHPSMLRNLSILDNIMLPGLAANKEPAGHILDRAHKLMEDMGIYGLEGRDVTQVSGGQLQRAAICRAMINRPDVLLLDEPTGALNSGATEQVLDILETLNDKGTTILTVTHDYRVAARAMKVIYIVDGEIAASKELTSVDNRELELAEWMESLSVATVCAA
jgi:putative ABC transport system ATP-binding protein